MKTAIVYYSLTGNVKFVCEAVAEKIGADLIPIEPVKEYPNKGMKKFLWGGKSAVMGEMPVLNPYDFDADKYDEIIFATPVWASTFTPPIRTFIKDNFDALKGKTFSVITCYSGGGAEKAIAKLKNFLNIDSFKATLILIDPKDRPGEDKQKAIEDFCNHFYTL